MDFAYSPHILATFFVTPALSTRMLFSFFKPSVADVTASERDSEACRPKAAASFSRIIVSVAWSSEIPAEQEGFCKPSRRPWH